MNASAPELQIERLKPDDAEALRTCRSRPGWNQVAADWRLMLAVGRGFGVRDAAGTWIASALALPLGPAISWLSMVLVTKPARRQGLGTRLLQRCLAEVEAQGVAAGLDATELGRPIYLPLGFRDVYPLSRWHAEAGHAPGRRTAAGHPWCGPQRRRTCRASTPTTASAGFARSRILAHLLSRAPALARVAERADGIACRLRPGPRRSPRQARRPGRGRRRGDRSGAAQRAVAATDERVIVDVPDGHGASRRGSQVRALRRRARFMRMLRGDAVPAVEDAGSVFALAGPELA